MAALSDVVQGDNRLMRARRYCPRLDAAVSQKLADISGARRAAVVTIKPIAARIAAIDSPRIEGLVSTATCRNVPVPAPARMPPRASAQAVRRPRARIVRSADSISTADTKSEPLRRACRIASNPTSSYSAWSSNMAVRLGSEKSRGRGLRREHLLAPSSTGPSSGRSAWRQSICQATRSFITAVEAVRLSRADRRCAPSSSPSRRKFGGDGFSRRLDERSVLLNQRTPAAATTVIATATAAPSTAVPPPPRTCSLPRLVTIAAAPVRARVSTAAASCCAERLAFRRAPTVKASVSR
jgi:hypothetical protein